MEERYWEQWDKRMMPDLCWSVKRDLNNTEHDNQERENSQHSSYVQEGFISAVSLLNHLMKILGLVNFNRIIFKDLQ